MSAYLAHRLIVSLLTLWLVTVVVFVILRVAPGDAVVAVIAQTPGEGTLTLDQINSRRESLGLNRPQIIQYFGWLGNVIRFQPGNSLINGKPVWTELRTRFAVTGQLTLFSMLLIVTVGPAFGIMASASQSGMVDLLIRGMTSLIISIPTFWIGLMAILTLASLFGYFRAAEFQFFWDRPLRNLEQIYLPAFILGLRPAALITRVVRQSIQDVLTADFIRAARSRGLNERTIIFKHAFRVAIFPSLTALSTQLVYLISGAIVIETVFNIPGVGRALVAGVSMRDYPTVQFLVLMFAVASISINFLVDLAYARLDPRVILGPMVR